MLKFKRKSPSAVARMWISEYAFYLISQKTVNGNLEITYTSLLK